MVAQLRCLFCENPCEINVKSMLADPPATRNCLHRVGRSYLLSLFLIGWCGSEKPMKFRIRIDETGGKEQDVESCGNRWFRSCTLADRQFGPILSTFLA